jgi:hypothetical protein
VPPSAAHRSIRRSITSRLRIRTVASSLASDNPAGATSSQCKPLIATPAAAASRPRAAAREAVISSGASARVNGASSMPS